MNLIPFYRRPGFKRFTSLVLFAGGYAAFSFLLEESPSPARILGDLVLALVCLILMAILAAQFVLPVRGWKQRLAASERLLLYLFGLRGPVMFIRNGKAVEAYAEHERRGKGAILIDYDSAAVLRTKTQFTKAVGPGLVFTDRDEHLAEALDLRRQMRTFLGKPPPSGEAVDSADVATLALTKDGIPVSVDLAVTFMLDPGHTGLPREGRHPRQPPFEFNPIAVERAVFRKAFHEGEDVPWVDLPIKLAADLWREQAKDVKLDDFLGVAQDTPTPLELIRDRILDRLAAPVEEPVGIERSRNHAQNREAYLLRSRGIRLLDLRISNLQVPEDIRRGHIEQWRETWAGSVDDALSEAQREADQAHQLGVGEAKQALAWELTAGLRGRLSEGEPPSRRDTLILLLQDAARVCSDKRMSPDASALSKHLRSIAEEIHNLDADCAPAQPRGGA